ncbi:MAG: hypothetical protein MZV65_43910 [Chromatiales bacterium]|nr:hypothetical protein [Chromatiales bacterium]
MAALARLARQDPQAAARAFERAQGHSFSARRARLHLWRSSGWQAALRPSARRRWPGTRPPASAAADANAQRAWKVRGAARAGLAAAAATPSRTCRPQLSTQPDWIYWRGRAHGGTRRGASEAQLLYRAIAGATQLLRQSWPARSSACR